VLGPIGITVTMGEIDFVAFPAPDGHVPADAIFSFEVRGSNRQVYGGYVKPPPGGHVRIPLPDEPGVYAVTCQVCYPDGTVQFLGDMQVQVIRDGRQRAAAAEWLTLLLAGRPTCSLWLHQVRDAYEFWLAGVDRPLGVHPVPWREILQLARELGFVDGEVWRLPDDHPLHRA
jgi:hypothetical protein